jgi:hypothetical protein
MLQIDASKLLLYAIDAHSFLGMGKKARQHVIVSEQSW